MLDYKCFKTVLQEIKFPLSVVLCHLVIKFLLASFIRLTYELYTRQHRVLLDCNNWAKKLSLIGISGGLDIGFSNWAQEFITVSLLVLHCSISHFQIFPGCSYKYLFAGTQCRSPPQSFLF